MREVVFLDKDIEIFFSSGDPFIKVKEIEGTVYRDLANRITKEFTINGKSYFVKTHFGVGWFEIFKNLLQFKKPSYSSLDEWKALNRLQETGLKCPEPLGYGVNGYNPAKLDSFIITRALSNTLSLEDITLNWKKNSPSKLVKDRLIFNVAMLSSKMHAMGMNHRDLYLCHFHVPKDDLLQEMYIIDLHRAQIRKNTPHRLKIKDIGGLLHSALDLNLSERDFYRFFMIYFGCSFRALFLHHNRFIEESSKRAFRMFLKPRENNRPRFYLNFIKSRKELLDIIRININKDIDI